MKDTEWVGCGRLGRALGLKGECVVSWNNGESPVDIGQEIFVSTKDISSCKPYKVAALRIQGRFHVVRFEGIEDRTAAEKIKGSELMLPSNKLPKLPTGQYYSYQILGMSVFTEDGKKLGKVIRIFTAGENDVYEILPDGGKNGDEILLPATDEVIIAIDVAAAKITVRLLEGML